MAFKGQSNGIDLLLKKRDRENDEEDEELNNLKKLSYYVPPPLYPPRTDIPPLPTIDIHNYTMITSVIKLKQNIPFSFYNLNSEEKIEESDYVERYSNRFKINKEKSKNSSLESKLPGIQFGYFPYDLITIKKKVKKRAIFNKVSIDGLQKEEEAGEKNQGEGGENTENNAENEEEEEEEEEDDDDGDYGNEEHVDDDEDMSDPEEGGNDNEGYF